MTSATVTPVAKVRQAVTMTVSPSWRQEHSAAAAENGSFRVSRSGDPSWLPISDDDDGSRCSRADFRKESGSTGGPSGRRGSVWEVSQLMLPRFSPLARQPSPPNLPSAVAGQVRELAIKGWEETLRFLVGDWIMVP